MAAPTITNGYLTLDELKAHLSSGSNMPTTYTPRDEQNMAFAIEAMSRVMDSLAETTFYARTETRYFTAAAFDLLYIDDLISVTSLKTDDNGDGVYEYTWSTSDYWLEPKNARVNADAEQMKPYRQIRVNPNGNYTFPVNVRYGVEIDGSWGYTIAPTPAVKQAMLLAANRIFRRKDAIFGVAGTPALGVTVVRARIEQDTDIMYLLKNGIDYRGFYS